MVIKGVVGWRRNGGDMESEKERTSDEVENSKKVGLETLRG